MKGMLFMFGLIGIMMMGTNDQKGRAQLREVTDQFQHLEVSQAAGYHLVSGPDLCIQHSALGGLGYRYVNSGLIDAKVDLLQPEGMIYVPGPNGALQLGAVEYIVPVSAWHATNTAVWPQIMGQQFHLNSSLGVYILHVWVWKDNPSGLFEDWNPTVSCL